MNISHENDSFIVRDSVYADRFVISKLAFKWDRETRTWSSKDISKAIALYDHATPETKALFDQHASTVNKSIAELKELACQPEYVKLIKVDNKFVINISFDNRKIASDAGFKFDKEAKRWFTTDVDNAIKLASYADDDLRSYFEQYQKEKVTTIQKSQSVDSEITIPVPEGLAYLPYQRGGIAYGSSRPNTLLADDMGLGKTIQAVGICNMDPTAERILIVCPASLKINWLREFKKWDVKGLSVAIAQPDMYPMANVVIINFDILKKHYRYIHQQTYDVLIIDEAHFLKNPKAKRTMDVFGNDKGELIKAKRKICLTGTPITNRPVEAWTLCHNLAPDVFPDFFQFAKRYCNAQKTKYGYDFSGSSKFRRTPTKATLYHHGAQAEIRGFKGVAKEA